VQLDGIVSLLSPNLSSVINANNKFSLLLSSIAQ